MDDPYAVLRDLIDQTPGVAAQLAQAHEAAQDARYAEAQVHAAIAADAIAAAHPDRITQPIELARALTRLFT